MESRIQPIKIRPSEHFSPKKLKIKVTGYEMFEGKNREGNTYNEERVYFSEAGVPHFICLNQKSLIALAKRGFDIENIDKLQQQLYGCTLWFEKVEEEVKFPYYTIVRVVKAK